MKDELQYILSGKSEVKHSAFIQTIASYLSGSQTAGTMAKDNQQYKAEETKELIQFVEEFQYWVKDIHIDQYVSQGAEQKVYLKDGKNFYYTN